MKTEKTTFYHSYTITNHPRDDEASIKLDGGLDQFRLLEVSVEVHRGEEWIETPYKFVFIGDHSLIAASLLSFEQALIMQASTDRSLHPHRGFRIKHNLHVSCREIEIHHSKERIIAYRLKFNGETIHDETGKRIY